MLNACVTFNLSYHAYICSLYPRSGTDASTSSAGCTATTRCSTPSSGQTPSSSRQEYPQTNKSASSLFSHLCWPDIFALLLIDATIATWIFMQQEEWVGSVWWYFQRASGGGDGCGPRCCGGGAGRPAHPAALGPASQTGTAQTLCIIRQFNNIPRPAQRGLNDFVEGLAFLRSYDSPPPPTPLLPSQSDRYSSDSASSGNSTINPTQPREDWIIYRGPGFLAVVWFGSTQPTSLPLSRQQVASLSQSSCVSPVELADGREGEGVGVEPNHIPKRKPGPLKIVQYGTLFPNLMTERGGGWAWSQIIRPQKSLVF